MLVLFLNIKHIWSFKLIRTHTKRIILLFFIILYFYVFYLLFLFLFLFFILFYLLFYFIFFCETEFDTFEASKHSDPIRRGSGISNHMQLSQTFEPKQKDRIILLFESEFEAC